MRIALVDPSLFTLPYDRELVSGLRQAGADVKLFGRPLRSNDVAPGDAGIDPMFYRIAEGRIGSRINGRSKLFLKGVDHYFSMKRFYKHVKFEKPNVIHFQWLALPLLDIAFLKALRRISPLLLTMHDTDPFNGDPSSSLQQRRFLDCVRLFDGVIVHTEKAAVKLAELRIDKKKIHVVQHGLLGPIPEYRDDPMQKDVNFLLFGKIKPYKGADVLIEAFSQLPKFLRQQAVINVVGKPYFNVSTLIKKAQDLGVGDRFHLTPDFVPDRMLNELFGVNTIAVFPYREIEASGVLMLALAYGRPIIASNLGSFAEMIDDGVSGLLVGPGDVSALTSAMARMLSDRSFAASCGLKARQIIDGIPSWQEIGSRTLEIYKSSGAR